MQGDPADLDPDGFLIGHAFDDDFLNLRFRTARDVSQAGRGLAPQISEELEAPNWRRALLVVKV